MKEMESAWNHSTNSEQNEVEYLHCFEIEIDENDLEAIDEGNVSSNDFYTREVENLVVNHEIVM